MQCPDGDLSFYFHIYLLISAVFSFSPGLPKLRSQELHHGGLHMQEISQLPYLEAIVPFLPLTHSPNQYILGVCSISINSSIWVLYPLYSKTWARMASV